MLNRLGPAVRDELFGADWTLIWGMRNRIAHGYLLIETAIVRKTLDSDIPPIVAGIGRPSGDRDRTLLRAGAGQVEQVAEPE